MTTNKQHVSKGMLVLMVALVMGICSCNDSATTDASKTDTTAHDTSTMSMPDTTMKPAGDTTATSDTIRDTKVPRN